MKFQSKYTNYVLLVKKSYFKRFADGERELVPGLRAKFRGPQRIFDSEIAQQELEWSDKDRKYVEDFILKNSAFGNGIYLAPGEKLTEKQMEIARWVPAGLRLKCQHYEVLDGNINQCKTEVTAGREFCADHDPMAPKITKGLSTTSTG